VGAAFSNVLEEHTELVWLGGEVMGKRVWLL
jgi:hypothetical protein